MTRRPTYTHVERARAHAWKLTTDTFPAGARRAAQYVMDGAARGELRDFCVPAEHVVASLLPDVREMALQLFAELGIPWHQGISGGPSNHLLSSQVQCVNALGRMVDDPDLLKRVFAGVLGTAEVLEIEPGRFLTFEYIGDDDCLNEGVGGRRVRGAHCTSVDAACLHRTRQGVVELLLIEWKYTESYSSRTVDAAKDEVRWSRYGAALSAPDGPVRSELLSFDDLLDEPLYQLVRQQLLAHELEKAGAHGAERVRVLHVAPAGNTAYQHSLSRPAPLALGQSVSEVWQRLLRHHDRFVSIASSLFSDPAITSGEYHWRYGEHLAATPDEAARLCGGDVESFLHVHAGYAGKAGVGDEGVELAVGAVSKVLAYPFSLSALLELASESAVDATGRIGDFG